MKTTEAQANAQGYFLHLGSEGGACGRPLRWYVLNREGLTVSPGFAIPGDALTWLKYAQDEPGDWHDAPEEGG